MDHVRRYRQIVVEEFGAQRVVGDDAADLRRRQEDDLRLAFAEPVEYGGLIAEVELAVRRGLLVRGGGLDCSGSRPRSDRFRAATAADVWRVSGLIRYHVSKG